MRFLLFIIILMALCSFCRKSFANSSVSKYHEKQDCKLAQLGVSSGFKWRQAQLEAEKRAISQRNSRNFSAANEVSLNGLSITGIEWMFSFSKPERASPSIQDSDAGPSQHCQHRSLSPPLEPRSLSPGDCPIQPTRSGCIRWFPKHYHDFNLRLPAPLHYTILKEVEANPPPLPQNQSPSPAGDAVNSTVPDVFETEPDSFGLYQVYTNLPTADPSDQACIYNMCDAPTFTTPPTSSQASIGTQIRETFFMLFANPTIYWFFAWFYNGNVSKSIGDLNDLVVNVLLAPVFNQEHLQKFDAAQELNWLDEHMKNPHFSVDDGWLEGPVKIWLPATRKKFKSEEKAPEFEVTSIHYRKLTQVIKSTFQDPLAKKFHYFPFKLFWSLNVSSQRSTTQMHS